MIAAYLRHNRSDQSYRLQREQLETRLASDSVAEFDWFLDYGHGVLIDRPAFCRLRRLIATGDVDALYTCSLDRLTRDPAEMEELINLCRSASTPLVMFDGFHAGLRD